MDKGAQTLLKHDAVSEIASATSKTPAQVLLRWATQRGIAVIPVRASGLRLLSSVLRRLF